MKELTLRKIAEACHGTVAPEAETVTVTGVQSDSRRVRPGDLFVAIKGEKADGHDFVAMAASLGAKAALAILSATSCCMVRSISCIAAVLFASVDRDSEAYSPYLLVCSRSSESAMYFSSVSRTDRPCFKTACFSTVISSQRAKSRSICGSSKPL